MCKFAYSSYEKILTDIRSYLRGIDSNNIQFLDYVKIIDEIVIDTRLFRVCLLQFFHMRHQASGIVFSEQKSILIILLRLPLFCGSSLSISLKI